jgi:pimeloyl-ACP methyl ester carboxylesterase
VQTYSAVLRQPPLTQIRPNPDGDDVVIKLPDGRTLGYRQFGDPHGVPVIALHGTPGSRLKFSGSHAAALTHGLRLIAVDRWGYGLSDAPRGRQALADYGTDIRALVDRLNFDRVHIVGVSGGGPYAAACALTLADRVRSLALVAPVGPMRGPLAGPGMSRFHQFCFHIVPRVPGATRAAFGLFRSGLARAPNWTMAVAMSRAAPIDQLAMRDVAIRSRLTKTFALGLARSLQGPQIDMTLFGQDWNLPLASIAAPTKCWIGLADLNVPLGPGRALARAIPTAELEELPGAGHLWIAKSPETVMAWLASHKPADEPRTRRA